jgi:hypothetical protein
MVNTEVNSQEQPTQNELTQPNEALTNPVTEAISANASLQIVNEVNNDNISEEAAPQQELPKVVEPTPATVGHLRVPAKEEKETAPAKKKKTDNKAAKLVYATVTIGEEVITIAPDRNIIACNLNGEEALAYYTVLKQRFENKKRLSKDKNQLTRQCIYGALTGVQISHNLATIPEFKDVKV